MADQIKLSRRSFLLMPLVAVACKPGQSLFELSGSTMGTSYNLTAIDPSGALAETDLRAAIDRALAEVNTGMSNWRSDSEISRFNAATDTQSHIVSPQLAEVMQAAQLVNHASQGAFDTTMGPLIELWGFGAPGARPLPADAQIDAARARSGHDNTLEVGGGALRKRQGDAQIYLAAIGKGYGADHVGRALENLGISDYMIEIGGDLYASGRNGNGQPWQIGIETPNRQDRSVMDVIGVSGLGLASSGDYRNYFEQDGQRFSHVIDPTTGRPITHRTASATVLADNAMLADAWATAMLILGRDRGLEIARAHDVAVMFIERDPDAAQLQFRKATSDRFDALTA